MPRTKSFYAALASLALATSCAAPTASTMPAASAPTLIDIKEDGVASVTFHGIPMIAFTDPAFKRLLIRQRGEKRDLELALAEQTIGREVAEIEAKRLRDSQTRTQWAATFGPWLGFAGGLTIAAVIAGIFGGIFGHAP